MTTKEQYRGALSSAPAFRSYPTEFEIREVGSGKVEVQGSASTTDDPYEMHDMFGPYDEVVQAGAFGKTLAEDPDVAFLLNHDGLTMARTASGTLSLSEDSTGLLSVATLNLERGDVRDLVTAIRDGDIDQMSFAFRIMRQQWSPDYMQRTITEVNLDRGDVSAVNYGANPSTSIGMRSFRSLRSGRLARMASAVRDGDDMTESQRATIADLVDEIARRSDRTIDERRLADIDQRGTEQPTPTGRSVEPEPTTAPASLSLEQEQEREKRHRYERSLV